MSEAEAILEELRKSPSDWEIRIRAIEHAVLSGDLAGARRLVREDPSDEPTTDAIKLRLHSLLTTGTAPSEEVALPSEPACGEGAKIVPVPPEESRPVIEPVPAESFDTLEAMVEKEVAPDKGEDPAPRRRPAPAVNRVSAKEKWANYDGDLNLVSADLPLPPERPHDAQERLSALTLAVIVHLIVFFLIGLVAVKVAMPPPPQLVVAVTHDREEELITPRVTKPDVEITPSAASAQAIDVIGTIASSDFTIPDVEASDTLVNSLLTGIQPMGDGMSFSSLEMKESNINFFGISGTGRKIVFIIDATPDMLVDEKGGMTAYDKVKEEVGIMLANLNRGTQFNILLYENKRLVSFREELVPGLPSNLRMAIEWLDPLNREYEALGISRSYGESLSVGDHEELPLQAADVAFYTKAIQKAMEWQVSSIFCISSGYERLRRSPTPEMLKQMMENPPSPGDPGTISEAEQRAWDNAVAKTREWLRKENDARREKGVPPKVVVNFNQLVQEVTGRTPPQRQGGTPGSNMPRLEPILPEDIEEHVEKLVKLEYKKEGLEEPSLHMVIFLGEDETIDEEEKHFRRLTSRNHGKLKVLRGLAALQNVTTSE